MKCLLGSHLGHEFSDECFDLLVFVEEIRLELQIGLVVSDLQVQLVTFMAVLHNTTNAVRIVEVNLLGSLLELLPVLEIHDVVGNVPSKGFKKGQKRP